jgi:hypothetical protein
MTQQIHQVLTILRCKQVETRTGTPKGLAIYE